MEVVGKEAVREFIEKTFINHSKAHRPPEKNGRMVVSDPVWEGIQDADRVEEKIYRFGGQVSGVDKLSWVFYRDGEKLHAIGQPEKAAS